MSDVRANSGVPVIAQFGGERTPSACAPIVVNIANGRPYTVASGDAVTAIALLSDTVIGTNTITNSQLAQADANSILGNNTGVAANVQYLTAAQVWAMLVPLKGIQRGTITLTAGNTTGTATITAVNTAKTELRFLGLAADNAGVANDFTYIVLTNSTTITATRTGGATGITISWELTEYV